MIVAEGIIGNLRFHDLRHACGTRIGEIHGVLAVADVLNQSQLSTAKKYVKRGGHSGRAIVEGLDNIQENAMFKNGTND